MLVFDNKNASDALDYTFDFSTWLETGDTLASATFSYTGPDTALTISIDNPTTHTPLINGGVGTTFASAYISGGTPGGQYTVFCNVVTVNGLTASRPATLYIYPLADTPIVSAEGSGVAAGLYTLPTVAVNAYGIVTAASSGNAAAVTVTNTFGGTQPMSLQARFSQSLSVTDFGPCGSGVADSAPAINAAFAYIRANQANTQALYELHFPNDTYTVLSSINATGIRPPDNSRTPSLIIQGHGSIINAAFNGGVVLDFMHCRFLRVYSLNIQTSGVVYPEGSTYSPAYGMTVGLVNLTDDCDAHIFSDIQIYGAFSVACSYWTGCETTSVLNHRAWNTSAVSTSYCVIVDGLDHFNFSSAFAPSSLIVGNQMSFNHLYWSQLDARHSGAGQPLFVCNASGHVYTASYVAAEAPGSNAVTLYTSNSTGSGQIANIYFDLHEEIGASNAVFYITSGNTSANIDGFTYKDFSPQASGYIFAVDSAMTSVTGRNVNIFVDAANASAKMFQSPAVWNISGYIACNKPSLISYASGMPATYAGQVNLSGDVRYFANDLTCVGTITAASIQAGTYTAGTLTATGYVTITDAGGTTRRLLVG